MVVVSGQFRQACFLEFTLDATDCKYSGIHPAFWAPWRSAMLGRVPRRATANGPGIEQRGKQTIAARSHCPQIDHTGSGSSEPPWGLPFAPDNPVCFVNFSAQEMRPRLPHWLVWSEGLITTLSYENP
jgi:hypothetical protein